MQIPVEDMVQVQTNMETRIRDIPRMTQGSLIHMMITDNPVDLEAMPMIEVGILIEENHHEVVMTHTADTQMTDGTMHLKN